MKWWPVSKRDDAFRLSLPKDWLPAVGENCYWRSSKASWCKINIVLLPDLFIVEFHHGGKKTRQESIDNLRPMK